MQRSLFELMTFVIAALPILNHMLIYKFFGSFTFIGITWHAEATLTDGFISGLSSIHRKSDVKITVDDRG
jgi:hypothetical protein